MKCLSTQEYRLIRIVHLGNCFAVRSAQGGQYAAAGQSGASRVHISAGKAIRYHEARPLGIDDVDPYPTNTLLAAPLTDAAAWHCHQVRMDDSHTQLQAIYQNREALPRTLRPHVRIVRPDGNLALETNGLGLQGPRGSGRAALGFWGDSFCFRFHPFDSRYEGWVDLLGARLDSHAVYNGSLPGVGWDEILWQCTQANRQHPFEFNIVSPGWHGCTPGWVGHASDLEQALLGLARTCPGLVLMTIPTSLNERVVNEPMGAFFVDGPTESGYRFWGSLDYSIDAAKGLFEAVSRRNDLIRRVARACALPLIDLQRLFRSDELPEFRT